LRILKDLSEPEIREIEQIVVDEGLGGWTWSEVTGTPALQIQHVPNWSDKTAQEFEAMGRSLVSILEDSYEVEVTELPADVTTLDEGNYDDFIQE
jgi:hypothetical protein